MEHPRFSLDELMARMELRCSRSALYEVLRYWELLEKERRPVRLRGLWGEEVPEKPAPLLKTAKDAAEAGQFRVPKKLNAHFAHFLNRMQSRAFAVCDPGPIVLAQFIDDLGVCEALQVYAPKRGEGSEITNLVLLNVCRILAGYETVGHLNRNSDRSVAVAAGVGVFPGKTALYDGFVDMKFEHLQDLRNDVAARARDLGLIRGERIAQDFHFKVSFRQARMKCCAGDLTWAKTFQEDSPWRRKNQKRSNVSKQYKPSFPTGAKTARNGTVFLSPYGMLLFPWWIISALINFPKHCT